MPLALASARETDLPLVAVNREFEDLTGYSAAESIGRNCRFLARKPPGSEQQSQLRLGLDNKQRVSQTVSNYRKCGETFTNFVTICPLFGLNGVVEYFLGSQVDVTRATNVAEKTLQLGPDAPVSAHLVQDSLSSGLRSAKVYTKSMQLLLQMTINDALKRHAAYGAASKLSLSGDAKCAYDDGSRGQD